MRSYAGLLVLEDLFDDVPTTDTNLLKLANSIFTPLVNVVEEDCGTTLGKFEILNFETQGLVELATGNSLSKERITFLLSKGVYKVYVRHISTCITDTGVCAKCYSSTYPDLVSPNLDSMVKVLPEYLFNAEILTGMTGQLTYGTTTPILNYDKHYVFKNDIFLIPEVDYTLSEGLLVLSKNLTPPIITGEDLVIRFINTTRSPFLVWLANTYSGALLGIKSLVYKNLPIRSLLLSKLLDPNVLILTEEILNKYKTIPDKYLSYIPSIKDPLEKALYMIALYSIYVN